MRIALTAGEPAGIGPDIVIKIAQQPSLGAEIVVFADTVLLQERAAQLNLPLQIKPYIKENDIRVHVPGDLVVWHCPLVRPVISGKLNPANAAYVMRTIELATQACLRGEFQALVTAPVHKGVINQAGLPFSGHTEYLAKLTGTSEVVMLLVADKLRVALVTTHIPLAQVPAAITSTKLEHIVQILHDGLQRQFNIVHPQILVCGLNPHAGENGYLGREEIEVITPVLTKLREKGLNLIGPLPADTIFTTHHLKDADAVLAMYHDQGLPVLKYCGFGAAVNVTLGLPIIRTSVDHGTAVDKAGTGEASAGSLLAAIQLAITLAKATDTDTSSIVEL